MSSPIGTARQSVLFPSTERMAPLARRDARALYVFVNERPIPLATRYPVADMSTLTIPLKLYKDDYLEFSANGNQTEDGHYCSVEARIVKVMP